MSPIDFLLAGAPVLAVLAAGFFFSRRGGRSTQDFVLGGRRLSWWLAGTAMVAGSSNADSPLHQSGKIRRDGLTGAWFYWSQIFGQLFGALVFSRLWRRSGLVTVVEFYDIRYAGKARTAGRVCSMLSAAFVEGTFGTALGLLAIMKLSQVFLGLDEPMHLASLEIAPGLMIAVAALALAASYSILSGLLGVVAGDVVEFAITLVCSYILMFCAYRAVGYHTGLQEGLEALNLGERLAFTPALGISALAFFVFQPLASAAGANGINQRYLAIRDERQSVLSGVWRIVNHYFVRCWPWHLCGLCSLVLLAGSGVADELAYPELIRRCVPSGLQGVMFGCFIIAFMGTASAAMHTSGAVFVNDLYRPYWVKGASDRHYLWAIRGAMLVFAVAATAVAAMSDRILDLLQLFAKVTSAAGLLMLLRWFFWRVNGWADVAAQISALPVALFYEYGERIFGAGRDPVAQLLRRFGSGFPDDHFAVSLLLTLGTTTAIWVVVMLLTPPEPMATLEAFYRRIRPYGFWGPVAARCPDVIITDRVTRDLCLYLLGVGVCLSLLFSGVAAFLGHGGVVVGLLTLAGACGWLLVRAINRSQSPDHGQNP